MPMMTTIRAAINCNSYLLLQSRLLIVTVAPTIVPVNCDSVVINYACAMVCPAGCPVVGIDSGMLPLGGAYNTVRAVAEFQGKVGI